MLLRLRYLLYRRFGPQPNASYLSFHGFKVMLVDKQREAERRARFVSLGVPPDDIAALADILLRTLEAEGVFEGSECNSNEIFDIARQCLGYETTMTKAAVQNLCARNLTELVACNVPESVHPREIIEWWRLQKSASLSG